MIIINKRKNRKASLEELKRAHPDVSWPTDLTKADLTKTNFALVLKTAKPYVAEGEVAVLKGYTQESHGWQEKWEIKKAVDNRSYKEKRVDAYPDMGDQLGAIMKWVATEKNIKFPKELEKLANEIAEVKKRYPKDKD